MFAGPSGLLLALELCRHGVRPRLVDIFNSLFLTPFNRAAWLLNS